MPRTRSACLTTAQAGQRPGGRWRGAPGSDPHAHRRARQTPSACESVVEAGRHRCTVTPSTRTSSR
eukprot:6331748-Alexandrium_andersonii.AAC.1